MGIFSRFGLIPNPPVKRPRDLAYASLERPPLPTLGILAFQHAATAQSLTDAQSPAQLSERIVEFVESSGAAWGARHEAIRRAAQAAVEAVEALHATGTRRATEIRGRFDEFNLDIEILHDGPPMILEPTAKAASNLLEVDDEAFEENLQRTMAQVSHILLQRVADRVHADQRHGQSSLRLHFDH